MQDISMISEIGGREYNQDYALYSEKNGKFCLALGDGLGSYNGSEIASKLAVETVIDWFNRNCDNPNLLTKKAIFDVFSAAHDAIREVKRDRAEIASSCTTLAVVLSDTETTIMAHVGDSRIYLLRQNSVAFRSKDHSLAQLAVERGEITVDQIPQHQDQNKLLRVVGSEYFVGPDISSSADPIKAGDGFLLCSDGVWEYLTDGEIEDAFAQNATSFEILKAMLALHDEEAADGCDNYTAIVAIKGDQA